MTDFGRNSKGFNPGINYFSKIFSFNFERNKLCYFLEAEWNKSLEFFQNGRGNQ